MDTELKGNGAAVMADPGLPADSDAGAVAIAPGFAGGLDDFPGAGGDEVANGDLLKSRLQNMTRMRRRREGTIPARFRISPAVEAAGQGRSGLSSLSFAMILSGPHLGRFSLC